MRLCVSTVVCLAMLATPPAAGAKSLRCFPAAATTVAGSGEVRVYERRGSVVACHLPSGRKLWLGREPQAAYERDEHGIVTVRVAGRFVAAVARRAALSPGDVTSDRLTLVDAERGRAIDIGSPGCEPLLAGYGAAGVAGVDVTPDGALAWGCSGDAVEIHKFDAAGPALLDSRPYDYRGPDYLEFDSVAISEANFGDPGGWVYWQTSQGAHRRAPAPVRSRGRAGGRGRPAGALRSGPQHDPGRLGAGAGLRAGPLRLRVPRRHRAHPAPGPRAASGALPRRPHRRHRAGRGALRRLHRAAPAPQRHGPLRPRPAPSPRRLARAPIDFGAVGCRRFPLVFGLDLTAEGAIAWGCEVGPEPSSRTEIRKFDRGGPALLSINAGAASSVAISDTGFGRAAGRVYWRTRDGPRSAALR